MLAIVLIVLFVWIASSVGQTVLARFVGLQDRPLERFVYSGAIGLGIAAYGVFGLGLCGLLSAWPVALWWMTLSLLGLRGMKAQVEDVRRWLRPCAVIETEEKPGQNRILNRVCVTILTLMGLISVVAAFQPPGPLAWDVLAYHLADPKVFVLDHRITILPTEHHSNFAFLVEMLFAVGLLYKGYALANLFHLALAALTTLCILAAGERHFGRGAGYIAATLFVTTPLVLWEASVAYIDVGAALYTTLAAVAGINAIAVSGIAGSGKAGGVRKGMEGTAPSRIHDAQSIAWITLAGVVMGFALGIKYLALIPLALIALVLLYRRMGAPAVARYAAIALVIGSPWYIKSAVLMGNPVYPFFYHLFPHSKYWSEGRAIAYESEQKRFGHKPNEPNAPLLNLLETPWRTLTDTSRYFNGGEVTFSAEIGGLYAAFGFAGLLLRRHRRETIDVAVLALSQLVVWFFLAQVGRYLIQILPLFALLAGDGAVRLLRFQLGKQGSAQRIIAAFTLLLLAGNALLTLWSVTLVPRVGNEATEFSNQTGLLPTALSLKDAIELAFHPGEREVWLSRHLDVYDAEQWINRNAPPGAGTVLYEETRGFYLDRPYLWGNDQHSTYIPYASFHSGADVTDWMNAHGIRYAIINLNWSAQNPDHQRILQDEAEARLQEWYIDRASQPGDWYRSVGQAIRAGLWTVVDVSKGNVVLQIGPSGPFTKVSRIIRQGRAD